MSTEWHCRLEGYWNTTEYDVDMANLHILKSI